MNIICSIYHDNILEKPIISKMGKLMKKQLKLVKLNLPIKT